MLEALWSVEFVSNSGNVGAGVAVFESGRVFGGDAQYTYIGSFESTSNMPLKANLKIRHYAGQRYSVFGHRKEFSLELSGTPEAKCFDMHGDIQGEPQSKIHIRLTKREELP